MTESKLDAMASLALGTSPVTLQQMIAAYATTQLISELTPTDRARGAAR